MSKLFKYFAASLLFMLAGFFAGLMFIPESIVAIANMLWTVILLVMIICSWITKSKRKRGLPRFSIYWVYLFTFVNGILLYPTLMYYLAALGVILFLNIILSTFLIFAVMSYIGAKQESGSFIGLSKILYIALTVLVIMSIVNLFLHIGWLPILLSAAGIVIFTLYIMVDINQFKTAEAMGLIRDEKDYSFFILGLFFDFINLMLDLLNIASIVKKD